MLFTAKGCVALLAEGVDRNNDDGDGFAWALVALLAEGVDRNTSRVYGSRIHCVALLAEGVDRNSTFRSFRAVLYRRPPRGGRG